MSFVEPCRKNLSYILAVLIKTRIVSVRHIVYPTHCSGSRLDVIRAARVCVFHQIRHLANKRPTNSSQDKNDPQTFASLGVVDLFPVGAFLEPFPFFFFFFLVFFSKSRRLSVSRDYARCVCTQSRYVVLPRLLHVLHILHSRLCSGEMGHTHTQRKTASFPPWYLLDGFRCCATLGRLGATRR